MTSQTIPLTVVGAPVTETVRKARQGLAIYFPVLIVASGIVEWLIIRNGDAIQNHLKLAFLLMWMPAFSSLVARVVLREGIRDVSFRFGGMASVRAIGIAILMPITVGTVAYGIAWATGLVGFGVIPPSPTALKVIPGLAAISGLGTLPRLLAYILISATISTLVGCTATAGEEIGWRGYMLTRLVAAGVRWPLVVSGVIWACWHFPLILSGSYAAGPSLLTSPALFLVDVVGIGLVIGVLRLRTGSVWPAIVLHAAWNAIIQGPFDRSSIGPGATVWVGESGIFVSIVSLLFGIVVYQW